MNLLFWPLEHQGLRLLVLPWRLQHLIHSFPIVVHVVRERPRPLEGVLVDLRLDFLEHIQSPVISGGVFFVGQLD